MMKTGTTTIFSLVVTNRENNCTSKKENVFYYQACSWVLCSNCSHSFQFLYTPNTVDCESIDYFHVIAIGNISKTVIKCMASSKGTPHYYSIYTARIINTKTNYQQLMPYSFIIMHKVKLLHIYSVLKQGKILYIYVNKQEGSYNIRNTEEAVLGSQSSLGHHTYQGP